MTFYIFNILRLPQNNRGGYKTLNIDYLRIYFQKGITER